MKRFGSALLNGTTAPFNRSYLDVVGNRIAFGKEELIVLFVDSHASHLSTRYGGPTDLPFGHRPLQ